MTMASHIQETQKQKKHVTVDSRVNSPNTHACRQWEQSQKGEGGEEKKKKKREKISSTENGSTKTTHGGSHHETSCSKSSKASGIKMKLLGRAVQCLGQVPAV